MSIESFNHTYLLWSTPNCSYCLLAEQVLKDNNCKYVVYKIGSNGITKEMFFEAMPEGVRTVPQIYKNTQYIGGYENLLKHFNHDNLKNS